MRSGQGRAERGSKEEGRVGRLGGMQALERNKHALPHNMMAERSCPDAAMCAQLCPPPQCCPSLSLGP